MSASELAALDYLQARSAGGAPKGARQDGVALGRTARLLSWLGDPHRRYRVIHVTGTNGKSSTTWTAASLLGVRGVRTGTFTSPHLESTTERIALDGSPIIEEQLASWIGAVQRAEEATGEQPGYFEILTVAALAGFAESGIEVAVVEVGIGGRFDATNVVDGEVAVITNVGLDHLELLGPTRAHIAYEKAGIVKPGSIAVLGEADPELAGEFSGLPSKKTWVMGNDFGYSANSAESGGRRLDLWTPGASYPDVWLALRGAHQGANAACALAAVEALAGAPLSYDQVEQGLARAQSPGRLELIRIGSRRVLLDGVKNAEGARAASQALLDEGYGYERRVVVAGLLGEREPKEMLIALGADRARLVVVCPAETPRTLPASELAAAAQSLGVTTRMCESVRQALEVALASVEEDEIVLVTGSLYVVGPARALLVGLGGRPR